MEFTINGRNLSISDRFREYASEKISKLEVLADKIQRIDAKISKIAASRSASQVLAVELTVQSRGPVIRAEAHGDDKFAAFDAAYAKLLERLRRAKDRKKIHRGRHTPVAVHEATAGLPTVPLGLVADPEPAPTPVAAPEPYESEADVPAGDSPVLIRRKIFPAEVMCVDDAVDNMELVGHDFYLFVDSTTNAPSVVYRRRGWTYGVISLNDADGTMPSSSTVSEQILAYRSDDRAASVG
ncbi:ribosome hibernation-promoting factor, HPF/YfiA family [Psychromicrobium xiongbiense]|uniref:ribosome hibernation-promoting factor, HPF/YfiA family n=1 Tax=Psychromicrobium xiongbiense TaxID=3051184 RepID=UPI0025528E0B|nr:ribosome-associated translation inhibitor RaiA [Psychromicrobium sp. YIM S02556]